MRPSWIPILAVMIALSCGAFTLLPARWGPRPFLGILAGMAMYFTAFTPTVIAARARTGMRPPMFGPRGIVPVVFLRSVGFLAILMSLSFVYFDRRSSLDVTWPVLILAAWNLSEGLLRSRVSARI
ncbi:MAG TPA: hypothetical protein VFD83_02810 [Candidatus Polarisedimenticolia bacterium]|nr:hypothetical protein [Candidatus Polarisedimenticolia bacterium]